jgi:hypothetical protein
LVGSALESGGKRPADPLVNIPALDFTLVSWTFTRVILSENGKRNLLCLPEPIRLAIRIRYGKPLPVRYNPPPGKAKRRRQKATTVVYSRKFPEQDRVIELVFNLMRQHPEGVTVNELNELMQAHNDKLQGEIAWFNSIDVLIDEGRVFTCPKWRERGYLESLKLYAK